MKIKHSLKSGGRHRSPKELITTMGGYILNVTIEEYEKGKLIFISETGRHKLGELCAREYRQLKKTPFFEPLTYLMQILNSALVCICLMAKSLLLTPLIYLWFFLFLTGNNLLGWDTVETKDIFSLNVLYISVFSMLISNLHEGIFKRKLPGFKNFFQIRFRQMLDEKIPPLKYAEGYRIRWILA
jgi:hypothetical protein